MNAYNIEYDSHSIFLRQKSNEKMKERLENIRNRKNSYFLPKICNTEYSCNSSKKQHVSVMDNGKFIIFF